MGLADRIRRRVLDESYRAGKGHIGPALSIVDIVAVLAPMVAGRGSYDKFVLSKGHAALAWYAALAELGVISETELESYGTDGTMLGTHPDPVLAGVEFQTGSLGIGITYGVGLALAARIQSQMARTYVLLSDSELNEGSTWEAALFAAHHQLAITVVVDRNGQQALGYTHDVLNTSGVPDAWRALGWGTAIVNGHREDQLRKALKRPEMPLLIIADTVAGKGVRFMERQIEWHYKPLSDADYAKAIAQVKGD